MTLPPPTRLLAALRLLFRRQADEALAALRRGTSAAPDLSHWLAPAAELLAPLLAPYYQHGGQEAARRIAAAVQSHPDLKHRPGWPRRSLRLVRTKAGPAVAFDVHRPEVQAAVQTAALALAQSTLDTSTLGVQQALDATRAALAEGLERGEVLARLTQRVQEVFAAPARAAAVAMTEAARAQHAGGLIAARDSGVVKALRWLASADACELCLKLDGKEVPLGDAFHVEGKAGPYSRVEHPPLHPHCMCSVTEVLGAAPAKPAAPEAPVPPQKPARRPRELVAPPPVPIPQPGSRRPRLLADNPRHMVWRPLADGEVRLPLRAADVPREVQVAGAQLVSDMPPEERQAVRDYTGSYFHALNAALRKQPDHPPTGPVAGVLDTDPDRDGKELFDRISSAIDRAAPLAQPLNCYRDLMLLPKKRAALLKAAEEAMASGHALQFGGFQSASLRPDMENFGEFRLEIRATQGAYLGDASKAGHEAEFLMPHNAAFRVLGVKKVWVSNDAASSTREVQVIQLEQIPDAHKQALPVVRDLKASARVVQPAAKSMRPRGRALARFAVSTLEGLRLVRPQ